MVIVIISFDNHLVIGLIRNDLPELITGVYFHSEHFMACGGKWMRR